MKQDRSHTFTAKQMVFICMFLSAFNTTQAGIITLNDFSPNATIESFEDLPASSNLTDVGDGFRELRGPVTLPSGIILQHSPDQLVPAPRLGDFSLGDATDAFGDTDPPVAPEHLPDGTAYLTTHSAARIVLTLPTPARKVGMYVLSSEHTQGIILQSGDVELERLDMPVDQPAAWSTSFVGFEHEQGIEVIEFGGPICRRLGGCGEIILLDAIIYEPIPEPSSLAFVLTTSLLVTRRVRSCKIG